MLNITKALETRSVALLRKLKKQYQWKSRHGMEIFSPRIRHTARQAPLYCVHTPSKVLLNSMKESEV